EVTLVGYTNAGKSSMLNALTGAGVLAENRLFATLDPRTRQLALPGGETVLATDTVGFISNLPHELVEAFMSTLDSVRLADLLVHVVDGSSEHAEEQIEAVRAVLDQIGAADVPELLVFNKCDLAEGRARELVARHPGSVWCSATTGENLPAVVGAIAVGLRVHDRAMTLRLPFERGDLVAAVHREGEVLSSRNEEGAVVLEVVLDEVGAARFAPWRVA
ncbi:MAG TPA: 50S ribosome-binding GTPase, partial [Acidimicrobiales bacterium]|nr:50S ribosome-binding GTPase [Acidimicrobiales bacterium]